MALDDIGHRRQELGHKGAEFLAAFCAHLAKAFAELGESTDVDLCIMACETYHCQAVERADKKGMCMIASLRNSILQNKLC
jgi:hypothetical protein